MARKTLLHIKSNVVENGRPKLPQASQLLPGEIAVNYADGYETLSIKNSNNEIVTFTNDETFLAYIDEQDRELATAAGIAMFGDSGLTLDVANFAYSANSEDYYLSGATSLYEADEILSEAVLENERVTAEGLNDLNSRVNTVSGNVTTVQNNLNSFQTQVGNAIEDIYDTIENLDAIDVDWTMNKNAVQHGDQVQYVIGVKIDNALDLTSPYPVANSAISTVIREDEEVIAASLNDLNNRLNTISGSVDSMSGYADSIDELEDNLDTLSGDFATHTADTTIHVTSSDKTTWNAKQNALTAGTGIDITNDVISCTLDTEISSFVNQLPVSGLTSKLYFVPNSNTGATTGNTYIEYAWHITGNTPDAGEWEELGEWKPDLTIDTELDLDSTNPVENQAISSAITRIEIVTSAALNDINVRLDEVSGLAEDNAAALELKADKATTYTKQEVDDLISASTITVDDEMSSASTNPVENRVIWAVFEEDEKVTAAALNDLNEKVDELSGTVVDISDAVSGMYTAEEIDDMIDDVRITVDDEFDSGSTNPVENRLITSAITTIDKVTSAALNDLNGRLYDTTSDVNSLDSQVYDLNTQVNQFGEDIEDIWDTIDNMGQLTANTLTGITVNNKNGTVSNNRATVTIGGADVKLSGYTHPANNTNDDPVSSANTVNQAFANVVSAMTDTEEVMSSAMNALHDELVDTELDVAALSGAVQDIIDNPVEPMVEITYSDLVTLKSGGNLAAGSWYRITDYQCTTTQANTSAATHQFDVVVLALSNNTLSEEARAMKHSGDTYFSGSTVNAWKIWYCLENDTNRFAWADTTNGKGVIWRMIDEFNNDIKYDFKNILFQRTITDGSYDTGGTNTWCYTLNIWYNNSCQDASVVGNTLVDCEGCNNTVIGVHDNIFGYLTAYDVNISDKNSFAYVLGNNVFLSYSVNDEYYGIETNTFGNNFQGNTIGYPVSYNTIGERFTDNLIAGDFSCNIIGCDFIENTTMGTFGYNTIGSYFVGNTIGVHFERNKIGNYFSENTIERDFASNTIGNYFSENTIGEDFDGNLIGNEFGNNTVGDQFSANLIGNECYSNEIGNYFRSNLIGNGFGSNTIGHLFSNNTVGNIFSVNVIGENFESNTIGNYVGYVVIGTQNGNNVSTINYVQFINIEDGVEYTDITTTASTSYNSQLQNIIIGRGIRGTSNNRKTISHPTVGDTFRTTYQPANSQVISV